MEKKYDIFVECTDAHCNVLEEGISELYNQWKRQGKDCRKLQKFMDFVEENSCLSVNFRDEDIQQFLEDDAIPTRNDVSDRKSRQFGSSPDAEKAVRSGPYDKDRNVFDTRIKDARDFRYLSLIIPNNSLGNRRYGFWHCRTKVRYKDLTWKDKVRFLRHNSLHGKHGYVVEKEDKNSDIDRERLAKETGCWRCVHFIVAMKFKDALEECDPNEWASLFPDPNDPKDHIEALTKEEVPPSEFKVFTMRKEYEWYLNHESSIETLPAAVKEITETIIKIVRMLDDKNIDLEQV